MLPSSVAEIEARVYRSERGGSVESWRDIASRVDASVTSSTSSQLFLAGSKTSPRNLLRTLLQVCQIPDRIVTRNSHRNSCKVFRLLVNFLRDVIECLRCYRSIIVVVGIACAYGIIYQVCIYTNRG